MRYEITNSTSSPLAFIHLDRNQRCRIERGAMVFKQGVDLEAHLNSNGSKGFGGFLKAVGRAIGSGESLFMTEAVGVDNKGLIAVAPDGLGQIKRIEVGTNQYFLNTDAFLASDQNVSYNMHTQSFSKAIFGGTGGFYVMETTGSGDMLISSFGDIIELNVTPDKPMTIDNNHVLAWSTTLDYSIEIASGTFGFKSGEGLVNTFRGDGKVLIQTRNFESFADKIIPYVPTSSN